MGKIDKFLAKPVEVSIGGERFSIRPFTVEDIPMLNRMGSKDVSVSSEAIQEAVFKVCKQIDPECTREQVNNISVEHLEDFLNAIGKANNMDIGEAKAKLLKENESITRA